MNNAPPSGASSDGERPAHGERQLRGDRQTEPGAAAAPSEKNGENTSARARQRHAGPGVGHLDAHARRRRRGRRTGARCRPPASSGRRSRPGWRRSAGCGRRRPPRRRPRPAAGRGRRRACAPVSRCVASQRVQQVGRRRPPRRRSVKRSASSFARSSRSPIRRSSRDASAAMTSNAAALLGRPLDDAVGQRRRRARGWPSAACAARARRASGTAARARCASRSAVDHVAERAVHDADLVAAGAVESHVVAPRAIAAVATTSRRSGAVMRPAEVEREQQRGGDRDHEGRGQALGPEDCVRRQGPPAAGPARSRRTAPMLPAGPGRKSWVRKTPADDQPATVAAGRATESKLRLAAVERVQSSVHAGHTGTPAAVRAGRSRGSDEVEVGARDRPDEVRMLIGRGAPAR